MRPAILALVWLALACAPAAAAQTGAAQTGAPQTDAAQTDSGLPGDAAAGAKLYKQFCRGCHGADGRGGGHTFMPHVDRLTRKGHIDLLPDEHLIAVITEGGAAFGMSSYMPAWAPRLTPQQIRDIVAHIRQLPLH
jgi:mono/diheme cytochrome c family protein